MGKQIHGSSLISGKFNGITTKQLKDRHGFPFSKICFSIDCEVKGKVTHPYFEARESLVASLRELKEGDFITVSFNTDCKNFGTGNELVINKAFFVEKIG